MVWGYEPTWPSLPWFMGGSWGDPGQGQVSSGDYIDRHDGGVVGIGDDKWRGTYKYTKEGSAGSSYVPISGYQSIRGMPAGTINAVPIVKYKPRYSSKDHYEHEKAMSISRTSNVVPWKSIGGYIPTLANLGLAAWYGNRRYGNKRVPNYAGVYNSLKNAYNSKFKKYPYKEGRAGGQTMYANRSLKIERYKKKKRKPRTFYK